MVSFKDKYDFDSWALDVYESGVIDIDTQIIKGGYLVSGLNEKIDDTG